MTARQWPWAACSSLNTIASPMSRVPGPLVTLVLTRTRENEFSRVGGTQVDPVLCRIVEEGQRRVLVVGDLGGGLGAPDPVVAGERLDRCPCVLKVLGQEDLVQRLASANVHALEERKANRPGVRQSIKPQGACSPRRGAIARPVARIRAATARLVRARQPDAQDLDYRAPSASHPSWLVDLPLEVASYALTTVVLAVLQDGWDPRNPQVRGPINASTGTLVAQRIEQLPPKWRRSPAVLSCGFAGPRGP